jgi:hypothetical protein
MLPFHFIPAMENNYRNKLLKIILYFSVFKTEAYTLNIKYSNSSTDTCLKKQKVSLIMSPTEQITEHLLGSNSHTECIYN